jgi:penicillin-binding protein 1B
LSRLTDFLERLRPIGRWLRAPFWLGLGVLVGFGVPYLIAMDRLVRTRFAELTFDEPSRVYARPLALAPKLALTPEALLAELSAARYLAVDVPLQPGTYHREGNRFEIATRAFASAQGPVAAQRIVVTLAGGRVSALADAATKKPIKGAFVDPARIATLYGARQEERRVVRAQDVPPLLVAALQAVEDRDFAHHHGIAPMAILRAAWVNLTAGEVVQGGSTLTQQLVRNLFLSRTQSWSRKANEATLALLIEARFSKARILEAYLNEIYLGQQGGQAVHGVAAASEFYFGHDLGSASLPEIALLIGLIQGPSLHDPRRFPERAKQRRNVVLGVMEETGLINPVDRAAASKAPLGVTPAGALARNRYPAFLDLVREQLRRDFPDSSLRSDGLTVLTTLAPATQSFAEAAVAERIKALGKNGETLQAAVVVTQARTGAIEAVVGGRDPGEQGFNRAVRAQRPIGSLVKPFVYLVALAQPQSWSLMTTLSDRAVSLKQPNGKTWKPANVDNTEHGDVALIDALAQSYNLATVRLGLELDVARVKRVLEALIPGALVNPNPSLLLGATDMSPLQVAQAYQYLAADGHPTALYAVSAVIDPQGRPLARHAEQPTPGDLVSAARLVTFALQHTARAGTAAALQKLGLGKLNPAGKTGTSNDQRDSWFAGYTGAHLAIVWLGADDNRQTGLFGSTGAMRIWAALFAKLPTEPLKLPLGEDPVLAWVDPAQQSLTEPECPGARQLAFARGFSPGGLGGCGWGYGPEDDVTGFGRARGDERYERLRPEDDYDARREELEYERARQLEDLRREQEREAREERPRRRFRDWFRRRDDEDVERERYEDQYEEDYERDEDYR